MKKLGIEKIPLGRDLSVGLVVGGIIGVIVYLAVFSMLKAVAGG